MGIVESQRQSSSRIRAAIAGFDVEGQATYRYLSAKGNYDITLLDEREVKVPEGVASRLGPGVFDDNLDFDEVWRTPGLAPFRLKTSARICSATAEFLANSPAPVIGVTGTKGKGTTASLIFEILKAAGRKAYLLGNIGQPALDLLDQIGADDVVVYEMSSFQLWDVKQSPQVAVVLMVEPEHLDKHKDEADYIQAKTNISRWQTQQDQVIYHPSNPLSAQIAEAGLGQKIKFLSPEGANITNSRLVIAGQDICSVDDFALPGNHNFENIAAAVTAAWRFTQDTGTIARAIKGFKGLPHRLQVVAERDGVKFVDDSIATTPSAAAAAIKAFPEPKILILGGSDKGSDYTQLAESLVEANMRKVLLIGAMAETLESALDEKGFNQYEIVGGTMADIVKRASQLAQSGDVVLLSPACASFDMFADYKDRAEQFKAGVEAL